MSEEDEQPTFCAICLTRSHTRANQEQLQCGHVFCNACIGQWRKRANSTCPLCRESVQMLRLYRRDTKESGLAGALLDQAYSERFGDQFCEPTSVMIGADVATVFFLPIAAFDDTMIDFFESFGYKAHDLQEKAEQSSDFNILDHIDAESAIFAKILLPCANARQRLDERLSWVSKEAMERLYRDPRVALMCRNNTKDVSRTFFPLYCRMIEFEVAFDEEPCRALHCTLPEFGLQDSAMATAIERDNLDDPIVILDRFGDTWRRAAQNVSRAEVEQVLCSLQNMASSRALHDKSQLTMMHENEARSIILFNRVRHCFCACCARKLPISDKEAIQTCKRCELAFYCSLECYQADLMSHSRYCCNEAARRERGIREISLATNAHAQQVSGAMSRGQHQFDSEELAAALQMASE